MKTLKIILSGAVCGLGLAGLMFAAATTTQTVTMQVNAIGVLAVSGNPSTLTVSAPGCRRRHAVQRVEQWDVRPVHLDRGRLQLPEAHRGVGRVRRGPGRLFAQADGDSVRAERTKALRRARSPCLRRPRTSSRRSRAVPPGRAGQTAPS